MVRPVDSHSTNWSSTLHRVTSYWTFVVNQLIDHELLHARLSRASPSSVRPALVAQWRSGSLLKSRIVVRVHSGVHKKMEGLSKFSPEKEEEDVVTRCCLNCGTPISSSIHDTRTAERGLVCRVCDEQECNIVETEERKRFEKIIRKPVG